MTLPDVIYWDWFTHEYCLEKDDISPPERYIVAYKNHDDTFIERWEVTNNSEGNRLSIAFTEDQYRGDVNLLIKLRQSRFDRYNCKPVRLTSFSIPKRLFEKYFSLALERTNVTKRVEALLERKDNEAS